MKPTPISREIIDRAIDEYGIQDYGNATIREVKAIAARAERESGQEFIKMEMGIPGLPAAQIGVAAQIKALQDGCARLYPDLPGQPMIKDATSRFIKAFIDVDVPPECCIPTVGSMQGTFASLLTITQSDKKKNKALFIDPGFPVQKLRMSPTRPSTSTSSAAPSCVPNSRNTCPRAMFAASSTAIPTTRHGSASPTKN